MLVLFLFLCWWLAERDAALLPVPCSAPASRTRGVVGTRISGLHINAPPHLHLPHLHLHLHHHHHHPHRGMSSVVSKSCIICLAWYYVSWASCDSTRPLTPRRQIQEQVRPQGQSPASIQCHSLLPSTGSCSFSPKAHYHCRIYNPCYAKNRHSRHPRKDIHSCTTNSAGGAYRRCSRTSPPRAW